MGLGALSPPRLRSSAARRHGRCLGHETSVWRHSLSLAGPPRYAQDFAHTDYVNPAAPKGGRIRLGAVGTFDNLNPLVSGVKGKLASHLMLLTSRC